jgi:hypothetical protein
VVVVVISEEVGRYAGLRDALGTAHAGALPARWRLVLLAPDALHCVVAPGPEAGHFSPEAGRFSPDACPDSHGPDTAALRLQRREGRGAGAGAGAATLLLLLANALLLLALLLLGSGRGGAARGLEGVGRAGRRDAALGTVGAPASRVSHLYAEAPARAQ